MSEGDRSAERSSDRRETSRVAPQNGSLRSVWEGKKNNLTENQLTTEPERSSTAKFWREHFSFFAFIDIYHLCGACGAKGGNSRAANKTNFKSFLMNRFVSIFGQLNVCR